MALSMELLKCLNATEEPLPKRLKLAENAFYANDVPIVRKEDLIIKWLCNTCSMDRIAWTTLNNCLRAKNLDIKIAVKEILINALIERFQNDIEHAHNDIFECCRLLICNIGIQQYFISKVEHLGHLTNSLLECGYKVFRHILKIEDETTEGIRISLINENGGLLLTIYNTIVSVMENIVQIFKISSNTKHEIRAIFIQDILYPACIIIDHSCTNNTNRLGAITHKCIEQVIFGRKYVQSAEFARDNDVAGLKELIPILTENAKTRSLACNLTTFTFFFRSAIIIFKSDSTILDTILRELIQCSGTYKKEILNSLLKDLDDLTFDFDHKIDGITLFDYCQNIIYNILMSKSMNSIDYDLLIQFSHFSPLLIEKNAHEILRKVFSEKSTLKYKDLMISLLTVYIHLRQEEKLFSMILITLANCLQQQSVLDINLFFPNDFKEVLMKAMSSITISQAAIMLRTLTYHLKTNCPELLQSMCKLIIMLQAIVELLTTVLDGICVFECNEKFASYKKFVNAFNELKNVLLDLVNKIPHFEQNTKLNGLLLSAVISWNEMQRTLKYYMPKNVSENLESPILETHWQKLIKNYADDPNYQTCINNLVLQQIKVAQHELDEDSVNVNDLIESYWSFILRNYVEVIPLFNNEQVLKLTNLLLEDISSDVDNCNEWIKVLCKDELQENKRFIVFFLNSIFTQVRRTVPRSVTKTICKYLNVEVLLEAESNDAELANSVLISIKKELSQNKWIQMQDKCFHKIKVYLELLCNLPLTFLSGNLRLIILLSTFALQMECNQSNEIVLLCNTIFSDLLERSDVDVFQYLDPFLLLHHLPKNRATLKAMGLYLRKSSYSNLKQLIKSSSSVSRESMTFLLESMEHVRSKLNTDQKATIKIAQQKLTNVIAQTLSVKITEANDMKTLNLILRINISNENISSTIKHAAETAINDTFVGHKDNILSNELVEGGLQLAVTMLHHRQLFHISNEAVRAIWYTSLKYPCADVLLPLLESCEPREFSDFLEELQTRLIKVLASGCESDIRNVCTTWNSILKTNMSNDRNKLRLAAISNLMQTMEVSHVSKGQWPHLLKLIQDILVTRHLYLPSYIIDMSIFLTLKALQSNTIEICNNALIVCNILIKIEATLIVDRMPSLLLVYRRILGVFVHISKTLVNKSEEHVLRCLALDIEKFTSYLIKLKKDVVRISPYLTADLIELFAENLATSQTKTVLQNCLTLLLSICDQHGIALLSRTLPVSLQEIFKSQLDIYNKFYKFSGKI